MDGLMGRCGLGFFLFLSYHVVIIVEIVTIFRTLVVNMMAMARAVLIVACFGSG